MQTSRSLAILALATLAAVPAVAQTIACPDLAQARQVAACPTEAELRYTFVGYCSDNARMYDGKADVCVDFEAYRSAKNTAFWESADGAFDGYLACTLAPDVVRAAKPLRIAVQRKGAIAQVACEYGGGIRFTYRTRATCRVEGAGSCDAPEGCRASCG